MGSRLRQRELRSEQRSPALERLGVAALADMVDRGGRLAGSDDQQLVCPLFLRLVHAVADRRPQSRRIGRLIEDPIGKGCEESLNLVVETALPSAIKTLQSHYLEQERRSEERRVGKECRS